jgi:glycosyltransferase involved in cell wall biosynthesis
LSVRGGPRHRPPSSAREHRPLRLLLTVTLNHNQLRSHLEPLISLPEVGSLTLVADEPGPSLPKLRTVVPPRLLVRILGRAGAKLVVCFALTLRQRPDWVMSYNLVPHGLTSLLVGRVFGVPRLLHLIGGRFEWEGGGWQGENRYFGRLRGPSARAERFLLGAIRGHDVVVTMGPVGRDLLLARGVPAGRLAVIPPSLAALELTQRPAEPAYDIVTAARLTPIKRLPDLLAAVSNLVAAGRTVRVGIAGEGPLEAELRDRIRQLGLDGVVELLGFRDPAEIYPNARAFVLCSEHEGLSIALLEAMATGLPSVVTDVGELGTLVDDGRNGFLIEPGDVDALTDRLGRLLDDPALRAELGARAAEDARALASPERVAAAYRAVLVPERAASEDRPASEVAAAAP